MSAQTPGPPPNQLPFPPPPPPKRGGAPWLIIGIFGCGCSVAVIAIMAAVLFPVFSQAREKARQTACLSNLKMTALGIRMYAQDYDETLPGAAAWMTDVFPYVKGERTYHCPSVDPGGGSRYGYAYNADMSRKSLEKVNAPQTTVITFDSTKRGRNQTDPLTSLPSPGRHSRGNNYSFLDGSAKWTPDSGESDAGAGY